VTISSDRVASGSAVSVASGSLTVNSVESSTGDIMLSVGSSVGQKVGDVSIMTGAGSSGGFV